jgi:hypothetical protein
MIRTFFSALGVLFAALLLFCASFVGKLGLEVSGQEAAYEKLAVDITRDLSRTWSVEEIKPHYAAELAPGLDAVVVQAHFDALRPLGALRYADDVKVDTGWSLDALKGIASPAEAADLVAQVLRKSVRVSFIAKLAEGFANVSMELRNERGQMKLWHLRIDSREPLPAPRSGPRKISHA